MPHEVLPQDTPQPDARPRLLLVDDEADLRAMLQRYLGDQGFVVRAVADATQMQRQLQRERFDLLVLDLTLPGVDGLTVCRDLRAAGETLPILMLTARGDPVDRIIGLEMGADDYLPKPFNPRELLARLRAMLRRNQMQAQLPVAQQEQVIHFGRYALDPVARSLRRDGEPLRLSSGEGAMLLALASRPGRPLSRERLIELAYGRDHASTDRSVDVQILRLRRLIEDDPAVPRFIQTVRGLGYVFTPDAVDASSSTAPEEAGR